MEMRNVFFQFPEEAERNKKLKMEKGAKIQNTEKMKSLFFKH